MTIFFTSDTHFGHQKAIEYSNRPFATVEEMNEALISNWNAVVKNTDTVYHLGDVSFSNAEETFRLISKLNGQKFLVFGNHDTAIRKNVPIQGRFNKCADIMDIVVKDDELPTGKQHIVLCHYPMMSWNRSHYCSWMLHGHSHGTLSHEGHGKIIDVGVDCFNMAPVSYEQLKSIMNLAA